MSRVSSGPATRRRKAKVLARAKGFRGRRSTCYRIAKGAVIKALTYAYAHRKAKKRYYRGLWNTRISIGLQELGISYSRFIGGLKKANITLDRKVLADLAIHDPKAFQEIATAVKKELAIK